MIKCQVNFGSNTIIDSKKCCFFAQGFFIGEGNNTRRFLLTSQTVVSGKETSATSSSGSKVFLKWCSSSFSGCNVFLKWCSSSFSGCNVFLKWMPLYLARKTEKEWKLLYRCLVSLVKVLESKITQTNTGKSEGRTN